MARGPSSAEAGLELDVGRVVASHGQRLTVEDVAGRRVPCRLHGRRLAAVCGDEVRWRYAHPGETYGTVYAVLPRRQALERLTASGRTEPVVANLTQLVVVAAPRPAPDWFVIDRYLAGAAWCGIAALIAFNKCDLGLGDEALAELDGYAALGIPTIRCSAKAAPGVGALAARLAGAVSVLVGQSGTGKSSLLNALVPEARAVTQEISAATDEGRHTTTHAVLHRLGSGGDLVDSPGVRDYAPPVPAPRAVASGFTEIRAAAAGCRFQDCLHLAEPGCAVRAGLEAGRIRTRRYESYRRLLALARDFGERFPQRRPRSTRR